jgi:Protein of unknown function (DUF2398)
VAGNRVSLPAGAPIRRPETAGGAPRLRELANRGDPGIISEATGLTTRAEAQDTFIALLTTPFVSARVAPARFAAVLQHRAQLTEWTGRFAYRLVIAGSVARLHRDPAGPQRTAAPAIGAPPSRRALTLVALTAAACEDVDMTTTVQALSDEVRAISAGPGARVMPYNPDRRTERQAFLRGVNQLAGLGILLRRTTDEALLRQWEEDGTGVGAGFEVDRDALLQFTDPHTVALALRQPEVEEDDEDSSDGLQSTPGMRTSLPTTPWTGGTPAPKRTAAGPGLNSAGAPKPTGKQTSSPCCSSPRLAGPTRT